MATRQASGKVIEFLSGKIPNLVGGSADLTGSNNTKSSNMRPITPDDANGNYVYYGIREFGMSAIMNGMTLHGGFIPFGGTFLVFTDYCRPAIRLSALMQQQVIYIMTHDSIGLGSDGPTHQPVEHVASLRAIPNLNVFRPSDIVETLESWQCALENTTGPSLICLTRQKTDFAERVSSKENNVKKGGYIIKDVEYPEAVIIATGSELGLAEKVCHHLSDKKIRLISMPCVDLFDKQDDNYKNSILGQDLPIFVIEAGVSTGWHKFIGRKGRFFGVENFGISADAQHVYDYFGLNVDTIVNKINEELK